MKSQVRLLAILAALSMVVAACSTDDENGNDTDTGADTGMDDSGMDDSGMDDTGGGGEDIIIDADITEDTLWTSDNRYFLSQLIFVTGAQLQIEAGTQVFGADGSALVVAADGQINANGSADAPIVFTSDRAEGSRSPGQWGGVVLLGRAEINSGTNNIEGMEASDASEYGGTDNSHNCGTLRYVRIEWAGSVFGTDNELNGLTVGGCGDQTTLEYIQVHGGLDDGIEFFGGVSDLNHAIVTRPGDDALDWDEGYAGRVQFLVVQQESANGDRGYEGDNDGDSPDIMPRSNPQVWNATLVGSGANAEQLGMKLRRGTAGDFGNTIVMGFQNGAIDIDSEESAAQATAENLSFDSLLFFNNGADGSTHFDVDSEDDDGGFDEEDFFTNTVNGTIFDQDPMLGDPNNLTAPNFVPDGSSPAATGATPPSPLDTSATYIGAFEPGGENWIDGWTAFPEN